MSALDWLLPRDSQPQEVVGLDPANPLVQGIVMHVPFHPAWGMRDIVRGNAIAATGLASMASSSRGLSPLFGTSNYADLTDTTGIVNLTDPVTIAWVQKFVSPSANNTVLHWKPLSAARTALIGYQGTSTSYRFVFGTSVNEWNFSSVASPTDGEERVCVIVCRAGLESATAGDFSVYINGVDQGTPAGTVLSANTTAGMRVGAVLAGTDPLEGGISRLTIWNRPLLEKEALEWSAHPDGIYEPQLIWVPVSAGGGSTITATTSLSAAIQAAQAATATVAAAIQTQRTTSADITAAIQIARTAQASVDGAIQASTTATATLTTAIQAAQTASASVSGAVQIGHTATSTVDGVIQVARSATAAVDAAIQAALSATASLTAYIQAGSNVSASVDAAIQTSRTGTASLDAAIQIARTATATLSAAVQASASATATLSAYIQAGTSASASVNAAIQAALSATASVDAAIAVARSASASLGAVIAVQSSISAALSAAVQARGAASASLSAYVYDDSIVDTDSAWWTFTVPADNLTFTVAADDLTYTIGV